MIIFIMTISSFYMKLQNLVSVPQLRPQNKAVFSSFLHDFTSFSLIPLLLVIFQLRFIGFVFTFNSLKYIFFTIWFGSFLELLHVFLCFYLFVHKSVFIIWGYEHAYVCEMSVNQEKMPMQVSSSLPIACIFQICYPGIG